MNENQAILDRPPAAGDIAAPSPEAAAASARARGPWLQFGAIERFEWNRHALPVASLPPALDGLRVLHLSDIHLKSTWHPAIDRLHERVRHDEPDLIFITGDFVDDRFDSRPAVPLVERLLRGLRSRFGVFGLVGNHDGDFIAPRVAAMGVTMLPTGSRKTIVVRGVPIELVGLAGQDRHDLGLQDLLDLTPPPRPGDHSRALQIVLSHYPDALAWIQRRDITPPLFFAGHTHGGQVCLPGGFPILRHDTLPRHYCSGVHRLNDTWLIVSRGMGYSTYPVRAFCPAEVVEVVLKVDTPTPSRSGRGPG